MEEEREGRERRKRVERRRKRVGDVDFVRAGEGMV